MIAQQKDEQEEGMKTEVVAKAKRRQYPAEYKLRILRELDECKIPGEGGALLRREGLYSSLVSKWREQRERGRLAGLAGQRRGPKVDRQAAELTRLQRENQRLKEEWERAELIIEVQKKLRNWLAPSRCRRTRATDAASGRTLPKDWAESCLSGSGCSSQPALPIQEAVQRIRGGEDFSTRPVCRREGSRAAGTQQRAFPGLCSA